MELAAAIKIGFRKIRGFKYLTSNKRCATDRLDHHAPDLRGYRENSRKIERI
jgi:hypothetical protein